VTNIPLPPRDYALRVGVPDTDDAMEQFIEVGRRMREEVLSLLPDGWSVEGRRILDFGCGSGRLLRHLAQFEAESAEIHGSDVDAELVDWVQGNLCPPIASAQANGYAPPLQFPDSYLDLVVATSVFTHITDQWSAWLLEMQRVLKPNGLLIATFLGSGMSEPLIHEAWEGDRIGMNCLGFARRTPFVLHSEWWLRAHWGRLFEILTLEPSGFVSPDDRELGHGVMLLRPRDVDLGIDDLERDEPGEDRYLAARRHHLRQLAQEGERLVAELETAA
jgi:SAM-dependent methyltransferase